jgi:chromosomal replication initiator protein
VTVNVWNKVLRTIETRINAGSYNTWFKPTAFLGIEDDVIKVQVPNEFFKDWLTRNYSQLLVEALRCHEVEAQHIEFQVRADTRSTGKPCRTAESPPRRSAGLLNSKYTFDSFVVGSCNQFANAAARAVAEEPSRVYNPLFLYGGVGLGKTHLMHAIGHSMKRGNPDLTLTYISTENFMNELVNAIRFDRTSEFRERYRSSDALLIDDIQFLAGKERTQEEFFHTFNSLYELQKQIIISSDCPPRAIPTLEERLHSRFEWGLIADIQSPDLETKIAILKKKAEAEKVMLSDDVVMFIAGKIKSNIRELEGALIRLIACASLTGRRIDLPFAREILDSVLPEHSRSVSIEQIIETVAEFYKLKPQDLKSKTNRHAVAHPRQVAMYLSKKLTGMSFPQIGRVFGGKHHTTVMHSVNVVGQRMAREPEFHKAVHSLLQSLQ